MKHRLREWLRRYLPAELLSALATLAAAGLVMRASRSGVRAALAGTWAGNVAYFGLLLAQDVRLARRARRQRGYAYTWRTFGQNLRALAVEFGAAEVLDSLVIRPALMYYLPRWLGHFAAGILLAKLLADVTFYIPAILSYELSKKRLRNFDDEP
ncbi:hypothetical protein [Hymenobacter properus]|uniref:Uncharacterized protein n=1 Tax=Hymenobacter properus TaxID=2791026 RepID=A0A931FLA6_9BACT|nr:hypothetical protein [Hymenobacter properus]MBF9142635.1 hypothetical protein [Hymenobacter properus]MBR7721443.1 hypothetical protein [Microvirga sp. SRT04]